MLRPTVLAPLLLAATLGTTLTTVGCSDDTPTTPTDTAAPTSITEMFSDSLNVNGGRTHPFTAQRAGDVIARLTSIAPDEAATIGLSIGTWNGSSCQIIIANDNVTVTAGTVIGSATGTGSFCVRIYDVGKLTGTVDYTVSVQHF